MASAAPGATERTPLLLERESTLDYATHVPEDVPVVEHDPYNLAALTPVNFWLLVSLDREWEDLNGQRGAVAGKRQG